MGGNNNFSADQAAGEEAWRHSPASSPPSAPTAPSSPAPCATWPGERGIRQFLDIGTGIPASNNTHEVAQSVAPETRVVYVDNDPMVLAHARALLGSGPHGATDGIDADLRDTGKILQIAARTIDFTEPVAVMLIAVLDLIRDEDNLRRIIEELMAAVPPGSSLSISHVPNDMHMGQMSDMSDRLNRLLAQPSTDRSRAEVTGFFDGLELVEPGVIPIQQWRPDNPEEASAVAAMWAASPSRTVSRLGEREC